MARTPSSHPTDGELEILRVLWDRGPSTLGQICESLRRERDVAATTVATMMNVMFNKKLVRRKRSTRVYHWSAAVTHDATAYSMVGKLIDGIFDGSAHRLVAHLVEAGRLSPEDRASIRKAIDSQKGK